MAKILIVDDDSLVLTATAGLLAQHGYEVDCSSHGDDAIAKVKMASDVYALILLDYRMDGKNGADTAQALLTIAPDTFILIYSGDGSREAMKETWAAGAVGFIEKGGDIEDLLTTVRNWYRKHEETIRALNPNQSYPGSEPLKEALGMVGRSPAMKSIASKVLLYRKSQQNVLVLGETGTGKELVAQALHKGVEAPFIAINCAAYKGSTDLLESELFGHEKGAFTGAISDKRGCLELAEGGTVFLDEVHHLSLTAQAKLLRAVQEKKVRRVGGSREYIVNFRIVAAAKPDLEERCEKGEFLLDLFHRLNVLTIDIPPLRERPEDIEPLVAHFCQRFGTASAGKAFLLGTIRYLEKYRWPGNIRELENTVTRLLTECPAQKITPRHLDAKFFATNEASGELTYSELKERHRREERTHLEKILKVSESKTQVAKKLRVSPSTLHSIMKRIGLYQSDGDSLQ